MTPHDGHEIEITFPAGSHTDAGYLRLKYSGHRGRYFTDMISVRPAYRRRGIATALMNQAAAALGYAPEPEAIVPSATARGFWQRQGFSAGFNQSKLEA